MSTIVFGAIGAGIGALIGGPAGARTGWAIGTTISTVVEQLNAPGIKTSNGKLTDLRLSGSSYGVDIPQAWGRVRLGGNVIWTAEDNTGNHLVEHSTTDSQGGGGGSGGGGGRVTTTEYSYSASFAVGICAGARTFPDGTQLNRITNPASLKRIWADDILILDADAGLGDDLDYIFYAGSEDQVPDDFMEEWVAAHPTRYAGTGVPAYRGLCYILFQNMDLTNFGNRIPTLSFEIETETVTVGNIVSDLARQTGLLEDEIDVSRATREVTGYVLNSRTTAQDGIAPILSVYFYDLPEVDGQIRPIARGADPIVTIPEGDLGARILDSGEEDPATLVEWIRTHENELPSKVEITYFNAAEDRNLEQSTQSDVRQTAWGQNNIALSTTLTLTDDEGKNFCSASLDAAWLERDSLSFSLPVKYSWTCPSDVLLLNYRGVYIKVRIIDTEQGLPGELRVKSVRDADTILGYSHTSGGSSSPGSSNPDLVVPTEFIAWSGKELRDQDQVRPGFYVAGTGVEGWRGATIYYSPDSGTSWIRQGNLSGRSVIGGVDGAFDDGPGVGVWDDTTVVRVNTIDGGLLSSTSEANVLAGTQNIARVGGEIFGFATVSLVAPGVYDLSHLRRGLRGSAYTGHASDEDFVEVGPRLARVNVPDSLVGETIEVRAVSPGQLISDVSSQNIAIAARTPTPLEDTVNEAVSDIAGKAPIDNPTFTGISLFTGGIGTGDRIAATSVGAIIAVQPIRDMTGAIVGYAPIYDTYS